MNSFFIISILLNIAWTLYLIFNAKTKYNVIYVGNVILMFLPMVNIVYPLMISYIMFTDGNIKLKPTKLNKFLFGTK